MRRRHRPGFLRLRIRRPATQARQGPRRPGRHGRQQEPRGGGGTRQSHRDLDVSVGARGAVGRAAARADEELAEAVLGGVRSRGAVPRG